MTRLECSTAACRATITVTAAEAESLTPAGAWTCQSCRVAQSLTPCGYCGYTAATCSRIPGRCCGSCGHRGATP